MQVAVIDDTSVNLMEAIEYLQELMYTVTMQDLAASTSYIYSCDYPACCDDSSGLMVSAERFSDTRVRNGIHPPTVGCLIENLEWPGVQPRAPPS